MINILIKMKHEIKDIVFRYIYILLTLSAIGAWLLHYTVYFDPRWTKSSLRLSSIYIMYITFCVFCQTGVFCDGLSPQHRFMFIC